MRVLIAGAGPIGTEYIRICRDQALGCVVVTRTAETAAAVAAAFDDVEVHHGGLSAYLAAHTPPPTAIIATPVRTLARMTELLIHAGVTSLLVEKPCCLSASAARGVATTAAEHAADVWIAFNRRHYASVQRARRHIVADGGVSSVWVEITEATDRIDPTGHPAAVLRRWGIANTSHVLDLAGPPTRLRAEQHGSAVLWHPAGSVFTGTGRTADGVPIAYHGDWGAPGRWRLEVNTRSRKLLFAPLEELQVQEYGRFTLETVQLDDGLDQRYKPGYYRQVKRFVAGGGDDLLPLTDLADRLQVYEEIFGYADTAMPGG